MPVVKKPLEITNATFGLDDEDTTDEFLAAETFGLDIEDSTDESEREISKASKRIKPFGIENGTTDVDMEDDFVESKAALFYKNKKPKPKPSKNGNREREEEEEEPELSLDIPFTAVRNFFHESNDKLPPEIKDFANEHQNLFDRWLYYLSENFNILLYGYGSKKLILDNFCAQKLRSNYYHVIVRGYLTSLRFKDVLLNLAETLTIKLESSSSIIVVARQFTEALDSHPDVPDVILVVHNIDGPNLRDNDIQTALSYLATSKYLHIIATVDHVNSSLLWDLAKLERFRWVTFDTPTYHSYIEEIIGAGNSKVLGLTNKTSSTLHSLTSLNSIWASLTQNAREIFSLLANNLREKTVSFWDLYKLCRENFIVNSEAALRQQLVEFDDHHLINKKTGPDGGETLEIAVDSGVLKQFFEERNLSEDEYDTS